MNLTEQITAAVQYAEDTWDIAVEPISAGDANGVPWVCVSTGEATPYVILDVHPRSVPTPVTLGDDITVSWRRDSLTAGAPTQVRAPKNTPIGGQWIDTPYTMLDKIMAESRGETLPEVNHGYTPQQIADEYAAALSEAWADPDLAITVYGTSGGDEYGTRLSGVVTDKVTGNEVGSFQRTMYPDGHVQHDEFKLRPEYQGKGMGSKMQSASEDYYRSLGYDRVEVMANIDVGGYTWARQGYKFKNSDEATDLLEYQIDSFVTRVATESGDSDLLAKFTGMKERAARGEEVLPAEIAGLGWTEGATSWLGKDALLGSKWWGTKSLTDSVTAAAVSDPAGQVGNLHRAWVPTAVYESVPVPYEVPSQYPETEEDVYTHPDSDAEFMTALAAIITPEGATP